MTKTNMLETKIKIINEHECAINLFVKYAFVGVMNAERKLPLFFVNGINCVHIIVKSHFQFQCELKPNPFFNKELENNDNNEILP